MHERDGECLRKSLRESKLEDTIVNTNAEKTKRIV